MDWAKYLTSNSTTKILPSVNSESNIQCKQLLAFEQQTARAKCILSALILYVGILFPF